MNPYLVLRSAAREVLKGNELFIEAFTDALVRMQAEYESKRCAVCHKPKWALYPFCRLCSIRLQRAHLMKFLKPLAGQDWRTWKAWMVVGYFRKYDICRDYLINSKREKKRREEDEEADEEA